MSAGAALLSEFSTGAPQPCSGEIFWDYTGYYAFAAYCRSDSRCRKLSPQCHPGRSEAQIRGLGACPELVEGATGQGLSGRPWAPEQVRGGNDGYCQTSANERRLQVSPASRRRRRNIRTSGQAPIFLPIILFFSLTYRFLSLISAPVNARIAPGAHRRGWGCLGQPEESPCGEARPATGSGAAPPPPRFLSGPPPLKRGRNSAADARGFWQRDPKGFRCKTPSRHNGYPSPSSEGEVPERSGGDGGVSGRRGPNCCKRIVSAEFLQNGMAPTSDRAGSGKPANPLILRPILWKPTGNFRSIAQGLLSYIRSFRVTIGRARRVAAVPKSEALQGFAPSAARRGRAVPAIFFQ